MDKLAETQVPLHPLLARRWSPRAFDNLHELTGDQVTALLEAARWTSSAGNSQPWRFLIATRGSQAFDDLFSVLAPGNQLWAGRAGALILAAAQTVTADGAEQPWAQYDTGQAVANLTAQAVHEGLVVHQMGGFDRAGAASLLGLPDGMLALTVIAVGHHDPAHELPGNLHAREHAPRTRRTIDEIQLRRPSASDPDAAQVTAGHGPPTRGGRCLRARSRSAGSPATARDACTNLIDRREVRAVNRVHCRRRS